MKQLTLIKTIKLLINENSDCITSFRRRINVIDILVKYKIKEVYTPDKLCLYKDYSEFIEVVTYAVAETYYYSYFEETGLDDESEEWSIIFSNIENYVKQNYGEELKKYYHMGCSD